MGAARHHPSRRAGAAAAAIAATCSTRTTSAGRGASGSHRIANLLALATTLLGFPRHLSQHTGGFVIARGKLSRLVPIENAAMLERSVIEWDKDDLDALGLLKVDVLALGMLSAIRRALDLIGLWRGAPFGMTDVPPEDPRVYAMIQRADTVGVFQIESRAQMSMLPRLKPKSFYDLVIEVAIVRPSPIQGGMVHPYLRRRQGLEPVTYPSEAVSSVLSRTLGVPIFQEQVMQLAVVAAGFTPGESDQLRRSMAAWRRKGGLEHFEQRLTSGMLARGYRRDFAAQIYQQILGFGEYGFPESHSASFALLVYVSAWIKCHEPAAFLAALLNSQPMGFYSPSMLIQDARRHGVTVLPPDVTVSDWDSSIDESGAVRLGLREISGFSKAVAERIATVDRKKCPFLNIADLSARAGLQRRDLDQLAAADALQSLAGHRRQAAWAAGVEKPVAAVQGDLFAGTTIREPDADLPRPSEAENLIADYHSLGLTLRRHPLALLRQHLFERRFVTAASLKTAGHCALIRAAGIVVGRQRPGTATGIVFVTLEDESGLVNVVVHPQLVEKQRRELLGATLLGVFGQLQIEGEVVHLVAKRLVDLSAWLGRLETSSRDFH